MPHNRLALYFIRLGTPRPAPAIAGDFEVADADSFVAGSIRMVLPPKEQQFLDTDQRSLI
jgi:hypothetical protein